MLQPSSSRMSCEVINRVLFHEYGFRGARENFENPENSFIHRVLDRREGLPISLCAIYIMVARRIGFELEPIGTPGRFLVGCFAEHHPFYIDCWAGGRFIELDQMEDKLGILPDEESGSTLLPVTVAETLSRACRNLSQHYSSAADPVKARLFESFVHEFERVHQKLPMLEETFLLDQLCRLQPNEVGLAVLGYPIKHSISPQLHTAALEVLALGDPAFACWNYRKIEVPPQHLSTALPRLVELGFRGLNLTIPHKVEILPLLSGIDPQAEIMGAVNTLKWENNGWHGYNTDGFGLSLAIRNAFQKSMADFDVLVLGAEVLPVQLWLSAYWKDATSLLFTIARPPVPMHFPKPFFRMKTIHPLLCSILSTILSGKTNNRYW